LPRMPREFQPHRPISAPTDRQPTRPREATVSEGNEGYQRDDATLRVSLHGPGVTIDDAIKAAAATKDLLDAIGREIGVEGVKWQATSVTFKCDGCGLTRPDRPRQDEGWTYDDGDDFCPSCTAVHPS
ncbi:hypothetical protein, partial [Flavobacterium sp.]|uniref:hypothetical protein n=1 Tax=Flavobacterium sp. TaxID=239 RepID=UPI003265C6AA